MTKRERLARMAGLVVTLLPLAPAQVAAHGAALQVAIPPDTVTTVFVTDTVPGFGAADGVASGPGPDHAEAGARLELVAPGA